MFSLKDVEVVFQNCDEETKQSVLNQLASGADYLVLPDGCTAAFIADNIMLIDGEGYDEGLFKVGGTD